MAYHQPVMFFWQIYHCCWCGAEATFASTLVGKTQGWLLSGVSFNGKQNQIGYDWILYLEAKDYRKDGDGTGSEAFGYCT